MTAHHKKSKIWWSKMTTWEQIKGQSKIRPDYKHQKKSIQFQAFFTLSVLKDMIDSKIEK